MTDDLFSAGFAWVDDVAASATPVATPETVEDAGFGGGSSATVAGLATPSATGWAPSQPLSYVENEALASLTVAGVAGVAPNDGGQSRRPLSQATVAGAATLAATPKTEDFCWPENAALGRVATVATVADELTERFGLTASLMLPDDAPSTANWRMGVEAMGKARPTPGFYHGRWGMLTADARQFLAMWGDDAVAAGWGTLDVFGANPDPNHRRFDRLGLVLLLRGRPVQELSADSATIGERQDTTTFYRHRRGAGAVPVWQWCKGGLQ